jgi:hypothetical protein
MRQIHGAVNSTDDNFIISNVNLAIPDLTLVIQALEQFQGFSKNIKECAIALYASELALQHGWQQSTAEFHVYAIAQARPVTGFTHLAGLGGQG